MTNKEAKRNMIGLLGYLAMIGSLDSPTNDSINMAIEALEKEERYRVRRLDKGETELPKEREVVLIYLDNYFGTVSNHLAYLDDGKWMYVENHGGVFDDYDADVWRLAAWKPIEPLEEEE